MKPVLGILLGEAAGIGPEIVAKMCAQDVFLKYCRPLIIGDIRILKTGMEIAGVEFPVHPVQDTANICYEGAVQVLDTKNLDPEDIVMGQISVRSGHATGETLLTALELCKKRDIEGLVYAPLNKAALIRGGFDYECEMSLMVHYLGWKEPSGEMNVVNDLWTTRATGHIPFKEVSSHLAPKGIVETIRLADQTLKRAGYTSPRIAVAALNPHAGENGLCGREEINVITPAIESAVYEGINAKGPFPSDAVFVNAFKGMYDAVVTLYHDQGQIALKLMSSQTTVTVAGGLPYPITTPSHGTAFDIAGKGIAKTDAMEKAVMIASKMTGWGR